MSDRTLTEPMTISVELSEPEPGVYVARARGGDGDGEQTLVESTESPYEAACDALASVTPSIDPIAGS